MTSSHPTLTSDLHLRPVRRGDLDEVAQLILYVCTAHGDPTMAVSAEDLRGEWQQQAFNLEPYAWVVETAQTQYLSRISLVIRMLHNCG